MLLTRSCAFVASFQILLTTSWQEVDWFGPLKIDASCTNQSHISLHLAARRSIHSAAVPTHICHLDRDLFETWTRPYPIQSHGKGTHAIGAYVVRLESCSEGKLLAFPVPVTVIRSLVIFLEFMPCFCTCFSSRSSGYFCYQSYCWYIVLFATSLF